MHGKAIDTNACVIKPCIITAFGIPHPQIWGFTLTGHHVACVCGLSARESACPAGIRAHVHPWADARPHRGSVTPARARTACDCPIRGVPWVWTFFSVWVWCQRLPGRGPGLCRSHGLHVLPHEHHGRPGLPALNDPAWMYVQVSWPGIFCFRPAPQHLTAAWPGKTFSEPNPGRKAFCHRGDRWPDPR